MSPRAAWRLESLGFAEVFDYAAGEADWFASGLPREGRNAAIPRAGDLVRRDVPTCTLGDTVGAVQIQVRSAGWDLCVIVNEERIVLGLVRGNALRADIATSAAQVMEAGPATVRPDARLDELAKRMWTRRVGAVIVTTSDGRLVGALRRADAERVIGAATTVRE